MRQFTVSNVSIINDIFWSIFESSINLAKWSVE